MRAWLRIDLQAIVSNARTLADQAAPAVLCAVIKANAYGHGMLPVAQALAAAGIPGLRFAVFSFYEGAALREAGITEPILVVGPLAGDAAPDAARLDLECALLSEDDIARFAPNRLRVHVKVDTGVSRFGVSPENASRAIARCSEAGLEVAGIYSHLANAEDLDREFTFEQLRRFQSAIGGQEGLVRHIAASAAAMLWPETRLDLARCGIALYGFWPSPLVRDAVHSRIALIPAMRWFAPIVQIRDVAAGHSVGYGCDFVPERDSTIAVLPTGYADGLPRAAGIGKLRVRFGTESAPIVGRVCMNACMVDVTDLRVRPTPRRDEIELGVEEVAAAAGTINYEILARLPASLERRYA